MARTEEFLELVLRDSLAGTCVLIGVERSHVTVALPGGLATAERGRRLLALEKELRQGWDPRAEVFLEGKGDLNKLRVMLRGVQM